eukprot:5777189-Alexandrium_andersonii.AAC.1
MQDDSCAMRVVLCTSCATQAVSRGLQADGTRCGASGNHDKVLSSPKERSRDRQARVITQRARLGHMGTRLVCLEESRSPV